MNLFPDALCLLLPHSFSSTAASQAECGWNVLATHGRTQSLEASHGLTQSLEVSHGLTQ